MPSGYLERVFVEDKKGRKRLSLLIRLAVAAALLTYLLLSEKLNLSVFAERSLRYEYLLLTLLVYTLITLKGAFRWYLLLSAVGVRIGYLTALRLTYLGHISSVVLPGVVGGDAVKALILHRERKERFSSVLTAALGDRTIGLAAMMSIALAVIPFLPKDALAETSIRIVVSILAALLFFSLLLFLLLPYLERPLKKLLIRLPWRRFWLRSAVAAFLLRRKLIHTTAAFGISIPAHLFSVFAVFCIIKAFGLSVPFPHLIFAVLVSLFIEALPISIAGLGVGEQAFDWLFAILFTTEVAPLGAEVALLMHITKILSSLPAILLLFIHPKRPPSTSDARSRDG